MILFCKAVKFYHRGGYFERNMCQNSAKSQEKALPKMVRKKMLIRAKVRKKSEKNETNFVWQPCYRQCLFACLITTHFMYIHLDFISNS